LKDTASPKTNRTRFQLFNQNQLKNLFETVTDGGKQAIHHIRESGSRYHGPPNYVILKEKIASEYYGFGIPVNSFMFKAYYEKVSQLQESGIIKWIHRKFNETKPIVNDDRVALSIDHLMIWFKLWIGLLLITSVVFLAEIWIGKCKAVLRSAKKKDVGDRYREI
jgi:hypothetical protein